ncbi:DoxX family protein [Colwellia sp. E2M01]|uniref:DoxX family protein n=1 Tax=Colwellia sp. E2M01 TaxID=2841561 RepID=UPI001C09B27E|nr:DoxX family protein [Colwellia sp. E2M01]MBU2869860.1 DoxX family protein [Colwellia sp. E2M01]
MIYWVTTILVSALLSLSAASYVFHQGTIDGVRDLGFPNFFRLELAALKFIAAIILVIPAIPVEVKEWAYSGVALFILTAIIAHVVHKDSFVITLVNLFFFGLLLTSRAYLYK